MFFYPLYNWFHATFVVSRTAYISTLWVAVGLLVALTFSWKRWLPFTLAAIVLIGVNLLAYSAAVAPSMSGAQRPSWIDVLLLSLIGVVCVTIYLQWRFGDPARRRR